MGDYGVRETGALGGVLKPLRLFHRVFRADCRLHMHCLGDICGTRQSDEVFGEKISLTEFSHLCPNQGRGSIGLPVAVEQIRMAHVVEMDMRVNEFDLIVHGFPLT